MVDELQQLRAEPDVIVAGRRADGALVAITRLITGWGLTLRRADGGAGTWDERWDYPPSELCGPVEAMLAVSSGYDALRDGREPEGWYRHRPSNRRRPLGDAAREEVRA